MAAALPQRALGAYILGNPYVMALAWIMIPAAIATAVAVKAPIVVTLLSFLPLLPMFSMLVAEGVGLANSAAIRGTATGVRDYARLVLGLLVYQAILAFAAARAVVREVRGTRGWEKTAHLGLHIGQPAQRARIGGAAGELRQPAAGRHLPQPCECGRDRPRRHSRRRRFPVSSTLPAQTPWRRAWSDRISWPRRQPMRQPSMR